jgi:glutamate dehydrogenase
MGAVQQQLEQALELVREHHDGLASVRIQRFFSCYYAGLAPDDLESRSCEDLYGGALSHWRLVESRLPGAPRVRVYNPEVQRHGWHSAHSVVDVVCEDMPFLVDSVRMALNRAGLTTHLVIHPVLRVRRDVDNRLAEVLDWHLESDGTTLEAIMRFEVDRQVEAQTLKRIETDVLHTLLDVYAAVEDWPQMRAHLVRALDSWAQSPPPCGVGAVAWASAFIQWLADDNFTLLGTQHTGALRAHGTARWKRAAGLGICRRSEGDGGTVWSDMTPPPGHGLAPLFIGKATARATVHRPGYLDYIGIKQFGADGAVISEVGFVGLYTADAYSLGTRQIPVLADKVANILCEAGYPPNSHAGKALLYILESYPRDLLFQVEEVALREAALEVLQLQERQRCRLIVHRDPFGRFASCVVYVPRERFNTERRIKLQKILEVELRGRADDFTVRLSESVLARLHFLVRLDAPLEAIDRSAIEQRLTAVMRDWRDDLAQAIREYFGEALGVRLIREYADAFGPHYIENYTAQMAVRDIEHMDKLQAQADGVAVALYQPREAPAEVMRFKLFREGSAVHLSDVLPMLENMGLRVTEERQNVIARDARAHVWLHDFKLTHALGSGLTFDAQLRANFEQTFARVWCGDADSDGFNQLVLAARLCCDQVEVLRAYCKYLRQIASPFSQAYMEHALAANATIAARLVELFSIRFDPDHSAVSRNKDAAALRDDILRRLDAVDNLDEDRILRAFLSVIDATLRTSWFISRGDGEHRRPLAFKFSCADVPDLPEPRPLYEIFVYSPQFEGIHLRGDKVARGGLRWSDRPEDFRTEVLGLVKAQMVKNAVIVPMGSKGGFVPKRLPAGGERECVQAEGTACYRAFITSLLSLTDNLVDGETVPPSGVVRYDDADPYLVVAADKGTATFSDIANEVALSRGFWLGDAFASGGSAGYDHKGMGITARGAWESVKRHFRELGLNTQTETFCVVGVGDMGGDVFGNGMLLSEHIALVAAFNHQHIFIDPKPNLAKSFEERQRLFELPRSSWADYNVDLLSSGGGVFPRSMKSISLSPEAAAALGTDAGMYTPAVLMRLIVKAPVDLLWNGGIGTYVRADTETDLDVGDRANDAIRVSASQLRCRVIGEGGNLGMTQLGRIQFALRGGRVNTDAIDNAAGVDCSDHEVNIKVLLNQMVSDGEMTLKQRNRLLAQMTDDVATLVLRNNYRQTQTLSLAGAQAASMVDVHARLMRDLELRANLDRDIEFLPATDALAERRANKIGLAAPELAVLLAYVKIDVYKSLLGSSFANDVAANQELLAYFPDVLATEYESQVLAHRLRPEIVSTVVANEIVNRAGTSFVFRVHEETGADVDDIARAYLCARDIFQIEALWAEVDALDNEVDAAVQSAMLLRARRVLERASRWLLSNATRPLDVLELTEFYRAGIETVGRQLVASLGAMALRELQSNIEAWSAAGVPAVLAERAAGLDEILAALDLVQVAHQTHTPVQVAEGVYFRLLESLQLGWLRNQVTALPRGNNWQALARSALRDDLLGLAAVLCADVLKIPSEAPVEERLAAWEERNQRAVSRCRQVLQDLAAGGNIDFAMLSVALRELRLLSARAAP